MNLADAMSKSGSVRLVYSNEFSGAGGRNRTYVSTLDRWRSATELRPHNFNENLVVVVRQIAR